MLLSFFPSFELHQRCILWTFGPLLQFQVDENPDKEKIFFSGDVEFLVQGAMWRPDLVTSSSYAKPQLGVYIYIYIYIHMYICIYMEKESNLADWIAPNIAICDIFLLDLEGAKRIGRYFFFKYLFSRSADSTSKCCSIPKSSNRFPSFRAGWMMLHLPQNICAATPSVKASPQLQHDGTELLCMDALVESCTERCTDGVFLKYLFRFVKAGRFKSRCVAYACTRVQSV